MVSRVLRRYAEQANSSKIAEGGSVSDVLHTGYGCVNDSGWVNGIEGTRHHVNGERKPDAEWTTCYRMPIRVIFQQGAAPDTTPGEPV